MYSFLFLNIKHEFNKPIYAVEAKAIATATPGRHMPKGLGNMLNRGVGKSMNHGNLLRRVCVCVCEGGVIRTVCYLPTYLCI